MEYFCNTCATIQYEEDLSRRYEQRDEPGYTVCGFCHSEDIEEIDPVTALAKLIECIPLYFKQRHRVYIGNLHEYVEDAL